MNRVDVNKKLSKFKKKKLSLIISFSLVVHEMFLPSSAFAVTTLPGKDIVTDYFNNANYTLQLGGNATWKSLFYQDSAAKGTLTIDGTNGAGVYNIKLSSHSNRYLYLSGGSLDKKINLTNVNVTVDPTTNTTIGGDYALFYIGGSTATAAGNIINLTGSTFDGLGGTGSNITNLSGEGNIFSFLNNSGLTTITGGSKGITFKNNRASSDESGVFQMFSTGATANFTGTGLITFDSNASGHYGGAMVFSSGGDSTFSAPSKFNKNFSGIYGGAIDIYSGTTTNLTFDNTSIFSGNFVWGNDTNASTNGLPYKYHNLGAWNGAHGGAINIGALGGTTKVTFNDISTFSNNFVYNESTVSTLAVGGAITAYSPSNSAAPYNITFNAKTTFSNNMVYSVNGNGNGGAIYYDTTASSLIINDGATFSNNYASNLGGALYLNSGTFSLNALTSDIVFQGNFDKVSFTADTVNLSITPNLTGAKPNAIYLAGASSNLNLNASAGRVINFYDPIATATGATIAVNKTGLGEVIFYGNNGSSSDYDSIVQANTNVNGGTFTLANQVKYGSLATGIFTVQTAGKLKGTNSATLLANTVNIASGGTIESNSGTFNITANSINLSGGILSGSGIATLTTSTPNITLLADSFLNAQSSTDTLDLTTKLTGGAFGITKTGLGKVIVEQAVSYTGITNIDAGTLQAGAVDTFSTSTAGIKVNAGATFDANNLDQSINGLNDGASGGGNVVLGTGILTVKNSAQNIFSGIISGAGSVNISPTASATMILSGDNTYTGITNITAGTLQLGNATSAGSIAGNANISSGATLSFKHNNSIAYAGILSGAGIVSQNGSTITDTTKLTGAGSSVGSVAVNSGNLELATADIFATVGNYSTSSIASTTIDSGSFLNVGGTYSNLGTLSVDINGFSSGSSPIITSQNATIGGTLNVANYLGSTSTKASLLGKVTIISSTNAISGAFSTVSLSGSSSLPSYLTSSYGLDATNKLYQVGTGLAWYDGATNATGTFDTTAGDFEVDVVLSDRAGLPANTAGWLGSNLTKSGSGTLTLSAANTYVGNTDVNGGTLIIDVAGGNSSAYSGDLTIASGAILQTNASNIFVNQLAASKTTINGEFDLQGFDQQLNNLTGLSSGKIDLGVSNLTIVNSGVGFNVYDGSLLGSGSLTVTGGTDANHLTLNGDNSGFTGAVNITNSSLHISTANDNAKDATLQSGQLFFDVGSASYAGNIDMDGASELKFNQDTSYAYNGTITGSGLVEQLNTGATKLTGVNSTSGSVLVSNGSLEFAQAGVFTATGDFKNSSTTIIDKVSSLAIGGVFDTSSNSLILNADSSFSGNSTPFITVTGSGGANLTGATLTVNGLNGSSVFSTSLTSASEIQSSTNKLTLIDAGTGTFGGTKFASVNLNGIIITGLEDYLSMYQGIDATDTKYQVGLGLAWFANNTAENGIFTLNNAADAFDVDIPLTVQTSTNPSWDGGTLTKEGLGTLTLSAQSDIIGLTVNAGAVNFSQTGATTMSGDVSINSSATLDLINASSILNIAGDLTFNNNSTFAIQLGSTGNIPVTANNINVNSGGSSLEILGFTGVPANDSQSLLTARTTIMQSSTSNNNTDFSSVTLSGLANYFVIGYHGWSGPGANDIYQVGYALAWDAINSSATGNFILEQVSDTFTVNTVLQDRNIPQYSPLWNGVDLTKDGLGTLILSSANTYTGDTIVKGGTLLINAAAGIGGYSGNISVESLNSGLLETDVSANIFANQLSSSTTTIDGTWKLLNGISQQANNLNGTTNTAIVDLDTAGLKLVNGDGINNTYAGSLNGSGTLTIANINPLSGSLTLQGDNTGFSGNIMLDAGMLNLQGANGNVGIASLTNGSLLQIQNLGAYENDINIDSSSKLEFNNSSNYTYAHTITGVSGSTVTVDSSLILTGTSNQIGTLDINNSLELNTADTVVVLDDLSINSSGKLKVEADTLLSLTGASSKFSTTNTSSLDLNVANGYTGAVPVINITSGSATLAGTLSVSGLSGAAFDGQVADDASLTSNLVTIIHATGGITGEFSSVSYTGVGAFPSYLATYNGVSASNQDYQIGLGLAWDSIDKDQANGSFNVDGINTPNTFTVTTNLTDNSLMSAGLGVGGWTGNSLTKLGSGTLVLANANTYSGGTTISEGVLQVGDGISTTASILGNSSIASGANLSFDPASGNSISYLGNISGAGSLTQMGVGTLVLAGANVHTGGTTISQGTLQLIDAGSLGSSDTINNGTLIFGTNLIGNDRVYNKIISGTGIVEINDANKVILGGDNNYSGLTDITQGTLVLTGNNTGVGGINIAAGSTLQVGNGGTTGLVTSDINNSGSLVFNRSDINAEYAGIITGGDVVQNGKGTLLLSGLSSTVNTMNVNDGVLLFNQGVFTTTGDYSTNSGATTNIGLGSSSLAIGGVFTQASNSTLTLTIGGRTTPEITANAVTLDGSLNVTGFSATRPIKASEIAGTQYTIIHADTSITGNFNPNPLSPTGLDYLLQQGAVVDNATSGQDYILGFQLAWNEGGQNLSTGTFTMANGTSFDIDTVLGTQLIPTGGFLYDNWDGDSLTKNGLGTLTLSAVNTYQGATIVNAGTLEMGAVDAIASSKAVKVNGTLDLNNYDQNIKNISGTGLISLGTANLTLDNALVTTDDTQFAGNISGSGNVDKIGNGVLTLTGNNLTTGITTISGGVLQIGNGSSVGSISGNIVDNATLTFNRNNLITYDGTLTGSGSLTQNGSGTLELNGIGSDIGSVDVNKGILSLAQNGVFNVQNDFTTSANAKTILGQDSSLIISGNLDQQAGSTLEITVGSNPDLVANTANISNSTLIIKGFNSTIPAKASQVIGNTYTVIHTISGITGDFSTPNPIRPSGLDYMVSQGGVSSDLKDYNIGLYLSWIDGGTELGTGTYTLAAGTSFDVDIKLSDQTGTFNSLWDGISLTKEGNGTLILSGVQNDYSGLTTINAGELRTDIANTLDSSSSVIINGGTLNLNGNDQLANQLSGTAGIINLAGATLTADNTAGDSIYSGSIIGTGKFEKSGSNILTLAGNSTYTGTTDVNDGTLIITGNNAGIGVVTIGSTGILQIGNGNTTGTIASDIVNNGSLVFNRGDDVDYNGVLSGTGNVTQIGSGITTLSAIGSDVDSITVSAGTLHFTQNGAITVQNGYVTEANATTDIGENGSYLDIKNGGYLQQDSSTLRVNIGDSPEIIADTAELNGNLVATGFSSAIPMKASEIPGQLYTIVHTTNGVTVNFAGLPSSPDYLLPEQHVSADGNDFLLGFDLSWTNGGKVRGTGSFSIYSGTSFDVDIALTSQTGVFDSAWDGNSLVKKEDGTLVLSAVNTYTGSTQINGGVLQAGIANTISNSNSIALNDGNFDLNGYDQKLNQLHNDASKNTSGKTPIITMGSANLTLNNSNGDSIYSGDIVGTGYLTKTGTGKLTLQGNTAWTGETNINAGTFVLDGSLGGAQLISNVIGQSGAMLSLINGASLTGTFDPADMNIDATSLWNITGASEVHDFANLGSINFVNTTTDSVSSFKGTTLNVYGNYTGGGNITLNTVLNDDNSATDKIIIAGNATGVTNITIKPVTGSSGGTTVQGIEIIDVAGESTGAFNLAAPVSVGAYDYLLVQGVDGNWYLSSAVEESIPVPELIRPEVGAYLANTDISNILFTQMMNDRYGNTMSEIEQRSHSFNVWSKILANRYHVDLGNGALSQTANSQSVQIGSDLFYHANDKGYFHTGIMFGTGSGSNSTDATKENAASNGTVNGYSIGVYNSWFADKDVLGGLYVDSWLQYNWFENKVSRSQVADISYNSRNLVASIEVGNTILLNKDLYIEPQLQVTYNKNYQSNLTDHSETTVKMLNNNGLETRLGAKLYKNIYFEDKGYITPYIGFNWRYRPHVEQVQMSQTAISSGVPKNRFEEHIGVVLNLGSWKVSADIGGQEGIKNYRQVSGQLNMQYSF